MIDTLTLLDVVIPYDAVGMFNDGLGGTVSVQTSPAYRVRMQVQDAQNDMVLLHIGPAEIMFNAQQARVIAEHLLAAAEVAEPA